MFKFQLRVSNNDRAIIDETITDKALENVFKKAEDILKKQNLKNFNKDMEIELADFKTPKNKYKMQWNNTPTFNGDSGYFKGWQNYTDGKVFIEKTTFLNTYLPPILFGLFNFCVLVLFYIISKDIFVSLDDKRNIQLVILFSIFLIGSIYSAAAPKFRTNLNEIAHSIKGIIGFNILLEIPIWLSVFVTILAAYNNGLFNISYHFSIIVQCCVIIILLVKISVAITLDINKFYNKTIKG